MTEQYSPFQEFDSEAAGQALGAQPRTTRDVAHGDGQAFDLTDAVLEVYPNAGVTRATTQDACVELFRVPRYEVRTEHVVFEQGAEDLRTRLTIGSDGRMSLRPVLRATEGPRTDGTATDRPKDSPTRTSCVRNRHRTKHHHSRASRGCTRGRAAWPSRP
jgi:hypothetical protein